MKFNSRSKTTRTYMEKYNHSKTEESDYNKKHNTLCAPPEDEQLTMSAPCTPLPRRFGAYSAKSTERNQCIILWLVHNITWSQRSSDWQEEENDQLLYFTLPYNHLGNNSLGRILFFQWKYTWLATSFKNCGWNFWCL